MAAYPSYDLINNAVGSPLAVASVPDYCSPRTDRMSFVDRFLNAYHIFRRLYIYRYQHLPNLEEVMRRYFPGMPSLPEMARNVSIVFVNEHPVAAYPKPRTPNVVPIGGILLKPPVPLPTEIQRFMDEASEGVIFFSLGTCVPEEIHSDDFFNLMSDVFRQLKQRVIWKTKRNIKNLPSHVMTAPWFPQQDILAHRKCVLFITHGGVNSVNEAIHFGVPVIGIPHFTDQRFNTMFCVSRGFGRFVELTELTRERLLDEINTVLKDDSYTRNIAKFSAISHDPPRTPKQSVLYWTNHVLQHGGSHLKPPPLAIYQIYLIDLLAAVVIFTAILVFCIIILLIRIFRLLKSIKNSRLNRQAVKKED